MKQAPLLERIRRHGVGASLRIAFSAVEAWCFDRRYGTDTVRRMPIEGLSVVGQNLAHGTHYDPSPIGPLRELIRKVGVPEGSSFVDFGCGKARTLMVAAGFPFRRVIGVEFARELADIGAANVAKYAGAVPGLAPMEVWCEDAARCRIDPDMGFFYLFNPFDEAVIAPLLENIRASVERHPRDIRVVYGHPVCEAAFASIGWLERMLDVKLRGRRFLAYRLAAGSRVGSGGRGGA